MMALIAIMPFQTSSSFDLQVDVFERLVTGESVTTYPADTRRSGVVDMVSVAL
jgi:hypothetical protein